MLRLVELVGAEAQSAIHLALAGDAEITAAAPVRPLLLAALATQSKKPTLVATSTFRQAENLVSELQAVLPQDETVFYPAWETLPHERLSPRSETVGRRLEVLRRLTGAQGTVPKLVVAPIRAVLQPQAKGIAKLTPIDVQVEQDYDLHALSKQLVEAAYVRTDMVLRRGEFAVRGGIMDVFSPTAEAPVRLDFFGDTLDEIRPFSISDQRSLPQTLPSAHFPPCRELLLTDATRKKAAELAKEYPDTAGGLGELFEKVGQGLAPEGMEALAPALTDGMELLIDVLPAGSTCVIVDPELVRSRSEELYTTSQEFLNSAWLGAAAGGKTPIDFAASAYRTLLEVRDRAHDDGHRWVGLGAFGADEGLDSMGRPGSGSGDEVSESGDGVSGSGERVGRSFADVATEVVEAHELPDFHGQTGKALDYIKEAVDANRRVALLAESSGLAKRLAEILQESQITPVIADDPETDPPKGHATIYVSELSHGFTVPGLAVLTLSDISGTRAQERARAKLPARRKNAIDPVDLKPGDAVVHETHGVGRFKELITRSVQGVTREYVVVEFASSKRGQPRDQLFVPMDQLHLLTRYVGGDAPALDKLGGGDWSKRKAKAKKAVQQIAAELVRLYAARQATQGYAFGPDTPWQAELEDNFSYVETPDQLTAISDVKRDMERSVPMDRLICGDVGYGKTEIAVRAAFKAVMDGKQVAVLVPTTLLAQQHVETFTERFAGFPVTIGSLSRFVTGKAKQKTLDGIASGAIDVCIGTHGLISDQVHFKDLGLVIIDEEQRFGVEAKEALKKLRLNVDVLAMSATPIPRTLEMAVTGIREMSVIATPPEERHPVLTFVGPSDETQIRAAIRRELAREGQAFYIHNRVSTINEKADELARLVPEARIAVAHGKLGEKALEQIMLDFWQRKYDVLVCTTIVEAGLDVTTANTLIIERADMLGLSQLHQLRGRVGRGRDRGYAYFFYPRERLLSETAHDRLATMASNTDLGSGMAIAMKDLEIRGAGNLLGDEQSGHIAEVGFDMYIRLVGEAVADYRGEDTTPEPEMRIELPVDAHLPVTYIESERLRLELYKRIAAAANEEAVSDIREELIDRFGPLPAEAEALLKVANFRLLAKAAGVHEVSLAGRMVRFAPVELKQSAELRLLRIYPGAQVRAAQSAIHVPRPQPAEIGAEPLSGEALVDWAAGVLKVISS
ncbi:MAG: transcription-repair coupling factor [Propionibacteriaceae bacterium]|nr:transcription-repair coupling factor [Propionibacteriaceae bacterium]